MVNSTIAPSMELNKPLKRIYQKTTQHNNADQYDIITLFIVKNGHAVDLREHYP